MTSSHDDTVDAFLNRVQEAWNAGDAQTYAAQFSEDASYIAFIGVAILGRPEIERTHHEVFTMWQKGTRMAVKPIDVRTVDADTTVVTTIGGIGTHPEFGYDKFQTYVLRRQEGRWLCVAFQNTAMSEEAKRAYNN
ncbi:SgcJ/EcaC family oxidoreductase [Streptantibioticus ferralitis]|uniref:SgcJ/EcaC family oxidoreductase n=1 Tax=Streptantibioticus ferralitis TaxID=236510 RepID=A0ABT5ZC61_9ACTN|nr:SgcJ/EcaC family oxidoreductase [Streptantibioticus ferralitis]MDF2261151.1 SgcJ/EcaC family oxidoreductase [Streptantibioticus ferralitis]